MLLWMKHLSGLSITVLMAATFAPLSPVQAQQAVPTTDCTAQPGVPDWFVPGLYRGKLGQQRVTVQFQQMQFQQVQASKTAVKRVEGEYFYQGQAANLNLSGGRSGDALVLSETVGSRSTVTGCLMLRSTQGGLSGQWTSPAGKRLPVRLEPLDISTVPLRLQNTPGLATLRREDPLTFLKLNTAWLKVAGGLKEPLSGIVYPRVAGASAALSGALQDRQLLNASAAVECRNYLGDQPGEGLTLRVKVTRLSAQLVSLHEHQDYSCGGPHPESSELGLILDRASGQAISLKALWPKLTDAELLRRYLAHYSTPDPQDCLEAINQEPDFTAWLSATGLRVFPNLPHVITACADTAGLPYAGLRPLADKQGHYFHDLYPR